MLIDYDRILDMGLGKDIIFEIYNKDELLLKIWTMSSILSQTLDFVK